ncbi:unnamed protein product [Pylaiella littoralis]
MWASTALKVLPAFSCFLLTPASGTYTSVGCAVDSPSARVMEMGPISETTMSAEICLGICLGMEITYTHFGTEYGNECFCTGDLGTTTESSACIMDCANTDGEICGGFDAISVYEIDPIPAPTPAPATLAPGSGDGFVSIGCAADYKNARIMPVGPLADTTPMSAEICFGLCLDFDPSSTHFGTQYSSQCFCTDDLGTTTESSACTMECANTEGEACGGFDAMSVYEIDSDPVPYVAIGCRTDRGDDRIMGTAVTSLSVMTAEVCYGLCSENESNTHFGTQYGVQCFCVDDPDLESINKHSDELPASEHCLMACAGDAEEMCGGDYEMSAYEITNEPQGDYTSLGCFPDPRDGSKAMEIMLTATEMSTEICYGLCISADTSYVFFGTEYSNECWCSTTFSEPTADGVCDYECAGNPSEICGGYDAISAYSIN